MAYELWETSTGNLIGSYATEQDALALIRRAIEAHGVAYADTIVLGFENQRGRSKVLAAGAALAERALSAKSA
jgi:hypothetical protein